MRRCSRADWVVDGRARLAGPDLIHKVSPVNACQQDASAREPTLVPHHEPGPLDFLTGTSARLGRCLRADSCLGVNRRRLRGFSAPVPTLPTANRPSQGAARREPRGCLGVCRSYGTRLGDGSVLIVRGEVWRPSPRAYAVDCTPPTAHPPMPAVRRHAIGLWTASAAAAREQQCRRGIVTLQQRPKARGRS